MFSAPFLKNTKSTDDEAVIEGENLIPGTIANFAVDSFKSRNRTRIYGRDDARMLIVATSGTGDREIEINNSNASTNAEADALAEAYKQDLGNLPPIGSCEAFGIETIKPGYLMVVTAPILANVHAYYRVVEITHIISKTGPGWRTRISVEDEERTIGTTIRDRIEKEKDTVQIINPNDMEFSYNFDFNSDTSIQHNGIISEGRLRMGTSSQVTMTTTARQADADITSIEMRAVGNDLGGIKFYASVNGGATWEQVQLDTATVLNHTGRKVAMKAIMTSDSNHPSPDLDSIGIYYKIQR